jgi:hypothetical protein
MHTDMNASHGDIVATARSRDGSLANGSQSFTTLRFTQGTNSICLFLPAKMAACAEMIAGAFNAHMTAEPGVGVREQVARNSPALLTDDEIRATLEGIDVPEVAVGPV